MSHLREIYIIRNGKVRGSRTIEIFTLAERLEKLRADKKYQKQSLKEKWKIFKQQHAF